MRVCIGLIVVGFDSSFVFKLFLTLLLLSSLLPPLSLSPQTHTLSHTLPSPPLSSPTPSSKGPLLYLQVPLSVVLEWDSATRQQLLYEMFVLRNQTDG